MGTLAEDARKAGLSEDEIAAAVAAEAEQRMDDQALAAVATGKDGDDDNGDDAADAAKAAADAAKAADDELKASVEAARKAALDAALEAGKTADEAAAAAALAEKTTRDAAAKAAADAAAAAKADSGRQGPFVPTLDTTTPEGLDKRIGEIQTEYTATATEQAAIKADAKAARLKFGKGEMTPEEYADAEEKLDGRREALAEKRDALKDEFNQLNTVKARAEQASVQNAQVVAQAIESERKAFFREAKKEGVDYSDPKLRTRLDIAFNAIATHPDNANRTVDDAYDTFVEAHQMVKAMIGFKPSGPMIVPKKNETPPREVPKTLGGLPPAAPADTGEDVLAKFNALSGEEAERYLAGLPKKEVDRILRLAS